MLGKTKVEHIIGGVIGAGVGLVLAQPVTRYHVMMHSYAAVTYPLYGALGVAGGLAKNCTKSAVVDGLIPIVALPAAPLLAGISGVVVPIATVFSCAVMGAVIGDKIGRRLKHKTEETKEIVEETVEETSKEGE